MTASHSRKLKIAVWHNLPSGGGKRALFDHVGGLVNRGHTVFEWCPPSADQSYLPLKPICAASNVIPYDLGTRKHLRFSGILKPLRDMQSNLRQIEKHCHDCAIQIERANCDVLFANTSAFFHAPPIGKFTTIPKLLYLQEPARWLYEASPQLLWAETVAKTPGVSLLRYWIRLIKDDISKRAIRAQVRAEIASAVAYPKILVNSLFSRESVLRAYGLESTVCRLGIDVGKFQPTGESREDFVISVGSFHRNKGADRVIRAIGTIPQDVRPRLVWIGNSTDRGYVEKMQALAIELSVQLELRILVSDVELVSMLSRAKCMVYAPRLEPFGYAPLEANACKTPVVGIAEGGVRETIADGHNGLLVANDDPRRLGAAISTLIQSPSRIESMGRQARDHVLANWSMLGAIDRIEEELCQAVGI